MTESRKAEAAGPAAGSAGKKIAGELAREAGQELLSYPEFSAGQTLKRAVKKLVGRKLPPADRFGWPGGLLALGLFRYLETADGPDSGWGENAGREGKGNGTDGNGRGGDDRAGSCAAALAKFFDSWAEKGWPMRSLEDMLSAQVLLLAFGSRSFRQPERQEAWKGGILRAAEFLKAYPRTEAGSLPYRADQDNGHVYVDALGMAAPFLVNYGLRFHDAAALQTGLRQFSNFQAYGMQEELGLPYHGYEGTGGIRHGVPGWGRGTGWLLLGLAEALTAFAQHSGGMQMPGTGTDAAAGQAADMAKEAEDAFVRLADTVCRYLREDGTLSWLLPAAQGPADSSGLAMCCYGLALGLREGLLPAGRYEAALEAGRNALARQVKEGKVYGASGECGGFGVYPQQYGAYPWSLGPALGFFALWPPAGGLQPQSEGI